MRNVNILLIELFASFYDYRGVLQYLTVRGKQYGRKHVSTSTCRRKTLKRN